MLTNEEMYEEIRQLWISMAKRDLYHNDLYLYFEQPQKGRGYHGEGEFYIYTKAHEYYFSYSERGTENIVAISESFTDIKFEIALIMSDSIVYQMIKSRKGKCIRRMNQETKTTIQLELLNNAGETIYRRAIDNYNKFGTLKIWKQ